MSDAATPNLPARDLAATSAFYARLGFTETYRDDGWMILARGSLMLEFFPFPDLDPAESSFGSCLRLDDVDAFYRLCLQAGLPESHRGFPGSTRRGSRRRGCGSARSSTPTGLCCGSSRTRSESRIPLWRRDSSQVGLSVPSAWVDTCSGRWNWLAWVRTRSSTWLPRVPTGSVTTSAICSSWPTSGR